MGVGTEGGLGKEGASGAKAFTALKAAASKYIANFNITCIVCSVASSAAASHSVAKLPMHAAKHHAWSRQIPA